LLAVGRDLRERHWLCQRGAGLDFVTVGDFAWYDSVLQTLAYLGCAPRRFGFDPRSLTLPQYFTLARGDADHPAMEMTKWFDTNYHYLVPEWSAESQFEGGVKWLFDEVMQARELGHAVKVSVVGPLTLLYLGKIKSGLAHKLDLLAQLIPAYSACSRTSSPGVSWVQVDEPILGLELDDRWLDGLQADVRDPRAHSTEAAACHLLRSRWRNTRPTLKSLPVSGIHLDWCATRQLADFAGRLPGVEDPVSRCRRRPATSGAPI